MKDHPIDLSNRKRYLADMLLLQRSNSHALLTLYNKLNKQEFKSYEIQRGLEVLSNRLRERIDVNKRHVANYIDETDAEEAATDAHELTAVLFPEKRGHGAFDTLMDLQGLFILLSATEASLIALMPAS